MFTLMYDKEMALQVAREEAFEDGVRLRTLIFGKTVARLKDGKSLEESILLSIDECIAEGLSADFLTRHREKLLGMFTLMYDEEMALQVAREEAFEDGEEKTKDRIISILKALKDNLPIEKISEQYNVTINEINQLRDFYMFLITA